MVEAVKYLTKEVILHHQNGPLRGLTQNSKLTSERKKRETSTKNLIDNLWTKEKCRWAQAKFLTIRIYSKKRVHSCLELSAKLNQGLELAEAKAVTEHQSSNIRANQNQSVHVQIIKEILLQQFLQTKIKTGKYQISCIFIHSSKFVQFNIAWAIYLKDNIWLFNFTKIIAILVFIK